MRYSSALVLSTLAAGQAAAANINRHASFHARRHAMEERNANYENVDWKKVSYDLSGVDWNSVFGKKTTSTSTPTPTPTSSKKQEVKAQAAATTPAYTPAAAKTTEAATPSATGGSDAGASVEGVVDYLESIGANFVSFYSDLYQGKTFTPNVLKPTKGQDDSIWIGDESNWKTTFINDGSRHIVLVCWTGGSNSWISKYTPNIAINLAPGQQQTISHAENAPGACAPGYPDTKLGMSGALKQVWYEFTFAKTYGNFDLSREPDMTAPVYTAKGSRCTSDENTCVFKCTDGTTTCGAAGSYDLFGCSAANGGGGGFDKVNKGTGGGCSMGADSEHVKVTFN